MGQGAVDLAIARYDNFIFFVISSSEM